MGEEEEGALRASILDAFSQQQTLITKLRQEVITLQKAKRENIRLPEESNADEDVSEELAINFRVPQNMKKHRTSKYNTKFNPIIGSQVRGVRGQRASISLTSTSTGGIVKKETETLVLRRGEEVMFQTNSEYGVHLFDNKLDSISIHIFESTERYQEYADVACQIYSSHSDTVSMQTVGSPASSGFIRFTIGSDFPIGQYLIRIVGESKNHRKLHLCQFEMFLLFNPYADEVLWNSTVDETYVSGNYGNICTGYLSRTWYYGQYESTILRALMLILHPCPIDLRKSPIQVAKFLAGKCNPYTSKLQLANYKLYHDGDDDNKKAKKASEEKNTSDGDETFAYSLTGSHDILNMYMKHYLENFKQAETTKTMNDISLYLDNHLVDVLPNSSWVFSSVLVGLLRCAGIPSRSVTIMDSPGAKSYDHCLLGGIFTVDKIFEMSGKTPSYLMQKGNYSNGRFPSDEMIRSSKSYFHCLADVFVNGKWMIVDCTSDGVMMGPLSRDQIYEKKKLTIEQAYFRRMLNGDVRYFMRESANDGGANGSRSHEAIWTFIHGSSESVGDKIFTANELGLGVDIRNEYEMQFTQENPTEIEKKLLRNVLLQYRDVDLGVPTSAKLACSCKMGNKTDGMIANEYTVQCERVQSANGTLKLLFSVSTLSQEDLNVRLMGCLSEEGMVLKTIDTTIAAQQIGRSQSQVIPFNFDHEEENNSVVEPRKTTIPFDLDEGRTMECLKRGYRHMEVAIFGYYGNSITNTSSNNATKFPTKIEPIIALTRYIELRLPPLELDYLDSKLLAKYENPFKSALTNIRFRCFVKDNKHDDDAELVLVVGSSTKRRIVWMDSGSSHIVIERERIEPGDTLDIQTNLSGELEDGLIVVTLDCKEFGMRAGANATLRIGDEEE